MATDTHRYPGRDLEAMSAAGNYHRWIRDAIAPYLGARVAEVGAGIGNLTHLLLETDVQALHAFEPAAEMFERLRAGVADPRVTPVHGFFDASHADGRYDSVVYVNVLEHVEDDRAEAANALRALRPGGHFIVFVPALAWLYSDFDRSVGHFRRYTKSGLAALVAGAGFEIVSNRWFDCAGVLPWYVNFVLLGNTMKPGSVSLYDRLVVPLTRAFERVVSPPLGKNVLLIARKPGAEPRT